MLITIGRECGCGADEIGKILSDKYGIPFYAKSELVKYAKEKGIYEKYPYFFGEVPTDFFMSSLDENVMERVRNTPKEALGKLTQDKDCIIIGRTSNFVFRNFIPMVVNAFKALPQAISTFFASAKPEIEAGLRQLLPEKTVNTIMSTFDKIGQFFSSFKNTGALTAVADAFNNISGIVSTMLLMI